MIPTNEWIDQANAILRERGHAPELTEEQATLLTEEMAQGATLPVALYWATSGAVDLTGLSESVDLSAIGALDPLPPVLQASVDALNLDALNPLDEPMAPPPPSAPTLIPAPLNPLQEAWEAHALEYGSIERRRPGHLVTAWADHCATVATPITQTRRRVAP